MPESLKQVGRTLKAWWMKFAHALGWINTRIILSISYFIIIAIPAIIMAVIGKDPLARKKTKAGSYWNDKEEDPRTLEQAKHQF